MAAGVGAWLGAEGSGVFSRVRLIRTFLASIPFPHPAGGHAVLSVAVEF